MPLGALKIEPNMVKNTEYSRVSAIAYTFCHRIQLESLLGHIFSPVYSEIKMFCVNKFCHKVSQTFPCSKFKRALSWIASLIKVASGKIGLVIRLFGDGGISTAGLNTTPIQGWQSEDRYINGV